MQWSSDEAQAQEGVWRSQGHPRARACMWGLGFALAIAFVWVWIGAYFMLLAIGSMADCFGLEPCTSLHQQGMTDGTHWGQLFAACAVVASALGVLAAGGVRWAAAALVVFCVVVAAVTFPQPSSQHGMQATGFMAVGLAPLVILGALKWWWSRG
jgi:hypothetical protein